MMTWHPTNWKTLPRVERRILRKQHRRRIWGPLRDQAREWILDAAILAADTGDEKHDWVVGQLIQAIAKLLPVWLRPLVRGRWFRGLLDGLVFDLFEAMRKLGAV